MGRGSANVDEERDYEGIGGEEIMNHFIVYREV